MVCWQMGYAVIEEIGCVTVELALACTGGGGLVRVAEGSSENTISGEVFLELMMSTIPVRGNIRHLDCWSCGADCWNGKLQNQYVHGHPNGLQVPPKLFLQ